MAVSQPARYEVLLEPCSTGLRGIARRRGGDIKGGLGLRPRVDVDTEGVLISPDPHEWSRSRSLRTRIHRLVSAEAGPELWAPHRLEVDVAPLLRRGDTLYIDQHAMGPWALAARRGERWQWGAGVASSLPPAMLPEREHARLGGLAPGQSLLIGDFALVGLGSHPVGLGYSDVVAMSRRQAAVDLAPLTPIAEQLLGPFAPLPYFGAA